MKKIYIHDIPGRLRVRSEAIKRNQSEAKELLASFQGVRSIEANALTGSLTLAYDVTAVRSEDLLGLLRQRGFLSAVPAPVPVRRSSEVGAKIARTVGSYVLQTAVERSVAALVAAIL